MQSTLFNSLAAMRKACILAVWSQSVRYKATGMLKGTGMPCCVPPCSHCVQRQSTHDHNESLFDGDTVNMHMLGPKPAPPELSIVTRCSRYGAGAGMFPCSPSATDSAAGRLRQSHPGYVRSDAFKPTRGTTPNSQGNQHACPAPTLVLRVALMLRQNKKRS